MSSPLEKGAFPWGRIVDTHTIGPYTIIEYAERGADNHPTHPRKETGRNLFHVPIRPDGHSGESYASLDLALIGSIDRRVNDGSSRATYYAAAVLGIKPE